MKARFSPSLAFGLALSILPFVGACTEDGAQSSLVGSANAQPAVAPTTNLPAPTVNAESAATEAEADAIVAVAEPAPATERKLPPTIRTNSPALDIIKMAQAGVDETVMLTFITNTSSMFVLTSDEIIYLNDLGVPSTVVTAMIQRDQEIKQFWSNTGQPAEQPQAMADAQASAPTYVDPPQPEPEPAPIEAEPAQPTVVNNNYFNDTLSPYGTWVEIDGYGRCWQPTVVVANRGWSPYSDGGRWVYTDAGWYWLSDYTWGATTFHYGRWFNHARWGWCWWPDTVWAPSWVSFRYSNDYCGWAPLPPHAYYRTGLGFSYYGRSVGFSFDFGLNSSCYTFVSWNRFCDSRPAHHRVRPHEVTRIYNNTTIVNNYVTGDNNTVINRGIGRDRVRDLARTEIKTVSLRDAGPNRGAGRRQERLERDGSTLVVNRPKFSPQAGRSSFAGGNPEEPGSVRPTRPESSTSAASTKQITARPDQRERPESVRTAPVISQPAKTTPSLTEVHPSPTAPVSVAPKTESRPARDRELPGNRNVRPNTSTTPAIANITRPATQPRTQSPNVNPTRPQQNSMIVVGKPQGSAPTVNRAYPVYNSPQSSSRPVEPQSLTPAPMTRPQSPTVNPTLPAPARQENSQITRSVTSLSRSERPVYSTSAPNAPTYSRPTPNYSPRVSPPAPAPTRSYSPPPVNTPRPTPSVSAPASTPRPAPAAPAASPRPAPPAPAVSAPRSSPPASQPSASSSSRSEPAGRPGR